jgi:hypothetical protein
MIRDPRFDQIESIISEMVKEAYERGRKDALEVIVKAATGQTGRTLIYEDDDTVQATGVLYNRVRIVEGVRRRAPRGSVETVIKRTLDKYPEGATVRQIMDERQSEGEQMIVDSSIRGELRRGAGTKYEEKGDRWHYANSPFL